MTLFDLGTVVDLYRALWAILPFPARALLLFGFGLSVLVDLWALRWVIKRVFRKKGPMIGPGLGHIYFVPIIEDPPPTLPPHAPTPEG